MSRVGRLVLWVKAPRSLRHFSALCRTPVQAQEDLLRQILGVMQVIGRIGQLAE